MADLTQFIGRNFKVEKTSDLSPKEQFREALRQEGIEPPPEIVFDGRFHRFKTSGKDKSGWYIVFPDNIPAGRFGDWRQDFSVKWCANIGRPLTMQEELARKRHLEEAKLAREAERKKTQEVVAETAEVIWNSCRPATADHPYLKRKGVQPHGIRVTTDNRLVLPLYNGKGEISSLQYIEADGSKKYHPSGSVDNKFFVLGEIEPLKPVFIAEGFATAASIYEATGDTTVVTYSVGNLVKVAGTLRAHYGMAQEFIIVADNDESGVGQNGARKAGEQYGMKVIVPPVIGDANDYLQAGYDLKALLKPPLESDFLVQADEFCKKPDPLRWLIKKYVQENALIMVHGPSGAGKSFVVLDWCLRISSGLPSWAGYGVKEAPVVYLAGEGHHGLKARIAAWKEYNHVESVNMWLSRSGCDLDKPEGYRLVSDHIKTLPEPPKLIVVDTLHRFLAGDENLAQDTRVMLTSCSSLMDEFECSVLLIHHTGVSEEAQHRARGSSAWKGALDTEISVVPGKNGGPLQIVQRKQKDGEIADPIWCDLVSVDIPGWLDEDDEQVTSAVVVPCDQPPEREKKDSEITRFKKLFQRAWRGTGENVVDGNPFIDKDSLIDFLIKNDGYAKGTAKNMVKPSHTNRLIGALINSEIIRPEGTGWVVIDAGLSSGMFTIKNSKVNK